MKTYFDRVLELDADIKRMQKEIKSGGYMAAGVRLSIGVGAETEEPNEFNVELGALADLEGLFAHILQGLIIQRKFYVGCMQEQVGKMSKYLQDNHYE